MRHIPTESEVLQQLIAWGEQQASVRAMILTSTRTVPNATLDVLSDYDVILALTDIHPFFEHWEWQEAFGRVLVLYRDPLLIDHGLEYSAYVTQFEEGLKVDFTLWSTAMLKRVAAEPKLPAELDAGYRILLDKDSLTNGLQAPSYQAYIPIPPTEAKYRETIEWFFQETTYAAKFLWRDDLVAAKFIMDQQMKQDFVRPMLEWCSEIEHDWSVKPGPYGRGLKRWIRPDLWTALEATYVGSDIEENWQALFRTIDLFRKVALEVADHLG